MSKAEHSNNNVDGGSGGGCRTQNMYANCELYYRANVCGARCVCVCMRKVIQSTFNSSNSVLSAFLMKLNGETGAWGWGGVRRFVFKHVSHWLQRYMNNSFFHCILFASAASLQAYRCAVLQDFFSSAHVNINGGPFQSSFFHRRRRCCRRPIHDINEFSTLFPFLRGCQLYSLLAQCQESTHFRIN